MPWITRDAAGKIVTFSANRREGATEIAADAPELSAFLNPSMERSVQIAAILDVLTDAEAKTMFTGKPRDLFRLLARNGDDIAASNPKLARLAGLIGTTTEALLARVTTA